MLTKVRALLYVLDTPQYAVCRFADMSPSRMSNIASGLVDPTERERQLIAEFFDLNEDDLVGEITMDDVLTM